MNSDINPFDTITIWCPLSEAELATVSELAAVGFYSNQICTVLQRSKRLFNRDFHTEGTPIHSAYNRGLLKEQYESDLAIAQNAKKGNLTAKQQMEKKYEEQRIENLRQKLFNNGG